jgi:hypothetical protein
MNKEDNIIVGYVVTTFDPCFYLAKNEDGRYYFHDNYYDNNGSKISSEIIIFDTEEDALKTIKNVTSDFDICIHPLYGYITNEKKVLGLTWK